MTNGYRPGVFPQILEGYILFSLAYHEVDNDQGLEDYLPVRQSELHQGHWASNLPSRSGLSGDCSTLERPPRFQLPPHVLRLRYARHTWIWVQQADGDTVSKRLSPQKLLSCRVMDGGLLHEETGAPHHRAGLLETWNGSHLDFRSSLLMYS